MTLPAPFSPENCDLRGFQWMPLDVTRLDQSDLAATATGDEFRAAVLLWGRAWLQVPAGSVPNDDRILARWVSVTPTKWKGLKRNALHGFVLCSDGRFYHPFLCEKAIEAFEKMDKKKKEKLQTAERVRRYKAKLKAGNSEENATNDADGNALPERDLTDREGHEKESEKDSSSSLRSEESSGSQSAPDTTEANEIAELFGQKPAEPEEQPTDVAPPQQPEPAPKKPKRTRKPKAEPKPDEMPEFSEAWKLWPRKDRGKRELAASAWKKAVNRGNTDATILLEVRAYLATPEALKPSPEGKRSAFVPGMHVWLNEKLEGFMEHRKEEETRPHDGAASAKVQTAFQRRDEEPEWFVAKARVIHERAPHQLARIRKFVAGFPEPNVIVLRQNPYLVDIQDELNMLFPGGLIRVREAQAPALSR